MKYAAIAVMALLAAGCTVGPKYKRPVVQAPDQFRGDRAPEAGTASLGDTKWQDLFPDETLRKLVQTALAQNFDLRIAAERVEQARAQMEARRSSLFPFFNWQSGWTAARGSSVGSLPFIARGTDLSYASSQTGLAASWELDFFGRLRRLNESARAQYLAAGENQLAVRMSLVAEVMNTYLLLLEQDRELAIGRRTREIAEDGLRLVTLRRDRGAATGLDVRQAEQLLYTATAQIAAAERNVAQTENALSLLLGQAPGEIARGGELEKIARPSQLTAGMPSTLLERRPDIRAAEQQLISANAEIGAARALYFPQISLSAAAGGQSRALTDILSSPARTASFGPSVILPIFRAGQIKAGVRLTEAQKREQLATYERTIFEGLRDVSDALAANDRTREQVNQQEKLVNALTDARRLSHMRYQGGLDSYLQVLDAERNFFQGQLALAQLRMLELQSVVRLYRALGGGWQ